MKNENNGKGIFYGVIGVATLIVAIIGATFAYFSATTASTEYVQGAAATASLGVHVDRLTSYSKGEGKEEATAASYVMVPQLDEGISQAIRGTSVSGVTAQDGSTACIDDNGSLVCSIYKITVQNTGTAAITVSGRIEFYGTSNKSDAGVENTTPGDTAPTAGNNLMNHLKWARLEDPEALTTAMADGVYSFADIEAINAKPLNLLTYANTEENEDGEAGYQVLDDGTVYSYQNVTNPNIYLYGMNVTVPTVSENFTEAERNTWKDLLGTTPTTVWSHGRYTDLIDPTAELKLDSTGGVNTYIPNNEGTGKYTPGQWQLAANGQTGDTKVFYIVVWISENLEEQNDVDFGQFTGQVTFESAGGTGATSTFTEAYQAPVEG